MLRLLNGKGFDEANPIQALFNKLVKDTPLALPSEGYVMQEILIGDTWIRIYSSFDVYKNALTEQ